MRSNNHGTLSHYNSSYNDMYGWTKNFFCILFNSWNKVIIALLAAYGFILRNKKIALAFGLTTLYSILIFLLPFFTTASDTVEGITGSDYWRVFIDSFVICLVICLIVLGVLILPLLIKKKGKSALSLLEKGGVITKVKIEFLVDIISNIALIVTTYMMVLSEMNRLGSH